MIIRYTNSGRFNDGREIYAHFSAAKREKEMHSNEFWELIHVLEGQGTLYLNDKEEFLKAGEFLLAKPGSVYSLVSPAKCDGVLVRICRCIFTEHYLDMVLKEYANIDKAQDYALYKEITGNKDFILHMSDNNISSIKGMLWLISHECGHFTIGSNEVIHNSLLNIFITLSRMYEGYVNKAERIVKDAAIEDLKNYMKTNFGHKITLQLLADRAHLSREYLARYFKECTGKTVLGYLSEIRISNAKRMLASSRHPIADIAEYCGYPSMSNFQKAFKKNTGMSPREYRKAAKISQDLHTQ